MSYVGGVRFRYNGPAEVCSRYNHVARVLIERTYAMYNVGGAYAADAATHTQVLLDGTVVKVTVFARANPIVTITPPEQPVPEPQRFEQLDYYGLSTQVKGTADSYAAYTALLGAGHNERVPPGTTWSSIPVFKGAAYANVDNPDRWIMKDGGFKLSQSMARMSMANQVQCPTLDPATVTTFPDDVWDGTSQHVVKGGMYNGTITGETTNPPPEGTNAYLGETEIGDIPTVISGGYEDRSDYWIMNHEGVLYAVEHPFPLLQEPYTAASTGRLIFSLNVWLVSSSFSVPGTDEERTAAIDAGRLVATVDVDLSDPDTDSFANICEIEDVRWDGKAVLIKTTEGESRNAGAWGRLSRFVNGIAEITLSVSDDPLVDGPAGIVVSWAGEFVAAVYNAEWAVGNPFNEKELFAVVRTGHTDVPQSMWDLLPSEILTNTVYDQTWDETALPLMSIDRTVSGVSLTASEKTDFSGNTYWEYSGSGGSVTWPGTFSAEGPGNPSLTADRGATPSLTVDDFWRTNVLRGDRFESSCQGEAGIVSAFYGQDGSAELVRSYVEVSTRDLTNYNPSFSGEFAYTGSLGEISWDFDVVRTVTREVEEEVSQVAVYTSTNTLYGKEEISVAQSTSTIAHSDSGGPSGAIPVPPDETITASAMVTYSSDITDFIDDAALSAISDSFTGDTTIDIQPPSLKTHVIANPHDEVWLGIDVGNNLPLVGADSFMQNPGAIVGDRLFRMFSLGSRLDPIVEVDEDTYIEAVFHNCAGGKLWCVETYVGNEATQESDYYISQVVTPFGKFGSTHLADGSQLDAFRTADSGTGDLAVGARAPWSLKHNCAWNPVTRQLALYFPSVTNFAGVWPRLWQYESFGTLDDPLQHTEVIGDDGLPVYVIDYRDGAITGLGADYED